MTILSEIGIIAGISFEVGVVIGLTYAVIREVKNRR